MKRSAEKAMFAKLYGYKNKATGQLVQYHPFKSKKDAELTKRLQGLKNYEVVRLNQYTDTAVMPGHQRRLTTRVATDGPGGRTVEFSAANYKRKLTPEDKKKILHDFKQWSGGYSPKDTLADSDDEQDVEENTPTVVNYLQYAGKDISKKIKRDYSLVEDFINDEASK